MKLHIKLLPAILVAALLASSCKDYLDVPPPSSVSELLAVRDSAKVNLIVNSAYEQIQANFYGGNNNVIIMSEMLGDNLDLSFAGNTGDGVFNTRGFSAVTDNPGDQIWGAGYSAIYRLNLVIQATEGAGQYASTQKFKNQILVEAKFLRALLHFDLCRIFAKPYSDDARESNPGIVIRTKVVSANATRSEAVPRARVTEVYAQVLSDLHECLRLIDSTPAPARVPVAAVHALMARVYYDMSDMNNAGLSADLAINTSGMSIEGSAPRDPFTNQGFGQNNGGILFQIYNVVSDDGSSSIRGAFYNRFAASTRLPLDSVENGDYLNSIVAAIRTGGQRREDSLLFGSSGVKKISHKWRGLDANASQPINTPVLRLAEMYLDRAEARRTAFSNEDGAREDLNVIRRIAGAADVDGSITGDALRDSIALERRRELVLEGDRYHELRRTRQSIRGLFDWNTGLLPLIPLSETTANPAIEQNRP